MTDYKKYVIEIRYRSGNSFGSHVETRLLELSWNNLNAAREALMRIAEYYDWYLACPKTSWAAKNTPIPPSPSWLPEGTDSRRSIVLKTDSGADCRFSPFWHGHFEKLIRARVMLKPDVSLEFNPGF